jgi:2-polyprenyl-3-methyl-5-hydroxy-6-metoxy-1,4-benzoquinol methylase/biotin operon repressor
MADDNADLELARATVTEDILGEVKSQAIHLAALLQLADLVKDEPKSVTELAQATGTHRSALYRLLYALASCGYFVEVEPGVFAQSPLSYVLRTDIPRSMGDYAHLHSAEWQWLLWTRASHSLQTGKEVFSEMFGKDLWHYFSEDNPEAGQLFARAMHAVSGQADPAIVQGYDFSSAGTVIDVGGGQGSFLTTVLQTYPSIRGTLFDQAAVIEIARQRPSLNELQERLTLIGGDFFTSIPSGNDIYILKHVIHDWEDPESIQILSNCRQAMNSGGRVLVIDEILTPGTKVAPRVALLDLHLLLTIPGGKRSVAEHQVLFEAAGFQLRQVYPTKSNYVILEAIAL